MRLRRRGSQFEAIEHKGKESLPTFKEEITSQSFQIMEESTAHCQGLAEKAVGSINQVLSGMGEKGEQIEGKQDGGQVFLTMPVRLSSRRSQSYVQGDSPGF